MSKYPKTPPDYPTIWCAPTGSIAGPELCAAVANAGGVGAMGVTWTDPETASIWVREVKEASPNGLFQVNFALAFPPTALDAVIEAGVPMVTFSWGDPTPYLPRLKESNIRVGVQVTSVLGAKKVSDMGVNFLICQGIEAGGHVQSTTPLFDLLTQLREADLGIPIIAAGGISTPDDVQKVLACGASGAMLGTRFVATQESRAHPEYKQALVRAAGASATALTVCFDGGWPYAAHRVLRNSTLEAWEAAGSPPINTRPGEGEMVAYTEGGEPIFRYEDTAPRVGMTGDLEAMCLYAGCGVGAITDIPTVAEMLLKFAHT
jgi:nitronate monooxygenase